MTHRNKWLLSLFCGGSLLAVLACSRPATTSADGPSESKPPVDKTQAQTEEKGKVQQQPNSGAAKEQTGSKQADETAKGYEFPGDQGGSLMKRLLTPRDSSSVARGQSAPLRRKPLGRVEDPSPGLPKFDPALPRVSMYGPTTPVRPVFVIPEVLLGDAGLTLALPEVQTMPTGPLLKLTSVDVNKPIGLSPMAQPLSGREPNTDPTKAASGDAAIKASMPVRTTPAPFVPESLPDPFENEATVKKLAPPSDESLPLGSGSQAPKK